MQRIVRLIVVWLVALALPVQGIAGMTMAHCGHGSDRSPTAQPQVGHQHGGHESASVHPHDSVAVESADLNDPAVAADLRPALADDFDDLAKCSSCASCCAGSALPSALPRILPAVPGPTVFVEPRVDIDAFATDGPDRPPRLLLA